MMNFSQIRTNRRLTVAYFGPLSPTEDPEGSPLSFLYTHNIQCKQVFRVFGGSTKVHIIKTKRRLKTGLQAENNTLNAPCRKYVETI